MYATCFTPIVLDSLVDYAGVQASLTVLGLLRHLTTSTLCEQSVVSSLFHTAQPDEPAQFCKRGKATRCNNRAKWGTQSIDIHSLCEARELVCVQAVPEISKWDGTLSHPVLENSNHRPTKTYQYGGMKQGVRNRNDTTPKLLLLATTIWPPCRWDSWWPGIWVVRGWFDLTFAVFDLVKSM